MVSSPQPGARRTLHLHIGAPKTGTSAIQAFLALNRAAFEAATGVHYPEAKSDERAAAGGTSAGNGARIAKLLRSRRSDAMDRALKRMEREFAAASGDLLLSSEGFWGVPPESFERFVRAVEPEAEIRILFYVRAQVRHVESAYLQVLGNRSYAGDAGSLFDSQADKFMPGARLQRLQALVGPERVTARKYDREQRGDVLDDFIGQFAGASTAVFERPAQVNASLDAEHFLYARSAAAQLAEGQSRKRTLRDVGRDPLLGQLYARAAGIRGIAVMDGATARRIRDACRSDNALLDALAPAGAFHLNEDNDRAVAEIEAAAGLPPEGLSRLELLLLERLTHLEAQVAALSPQPGTADADGDEDED